MKKVKVLSSSIQGKGLFADEPIKKGERIFYIPGERKLRAIRSEKESWRFINWIGVGKKVWINPNKTIARHLNHSCDPNSAIIGKKTMMAIKDIKKDEEITFDYSFTDVDPHWKIKCNCGSKNCRGVIGHIYSVPLDIFKERYPHIPIYFQRAYFRHHIRTRREALAGK